MKSFGKIVIAAVAVGGIVATTTMYAAPGIGGNPSSEQLLMKAGAIRDQMANDLRRVQHLQALARKERDVVKLNCINDKLVQMKPLLNVAERASVELQVGQTSLDVQGSLTVIVQAGENMRMQREAAEQCIGRGQLTTESSNEFTHPLIPDYPTVAGGGLYGIEPPAYASPFN